MFLIFDVVIEFGSCRDMGSFVYRVGNEPSENEHCCERAEHYEHMSEQRPSPTHERRAKARLGSMFRRQQRDKYSLLASYVVLENGRNTDVNSIVHLML